MYYHAKSVFSAIQKNGVKEFFYSSLTSATQIANEQETQTLYQKIKQEVSEAQSIASGLGLTAKPLYWVVPKFHEHSRTVEDVMQEFPYSGFKLHTRANIWDFSRSKTKALASQVFQYAGLHKLPVLVHTGFDDIDRADVFEDFFETFSQAFLETSSQTSLENHKQKIDKEKTSDTFTETLTGKIILAHCRPLETTLHLLQKYSYVFCDTAFVNKETIEKVYARGFGKRVLWGSDFPITDFFYNKRKHSTVMPSSQELYERYREDRGNNG